MDGEGSVSEITAMRSRTSVSNDALVLERNSEQRVDQDTWVRSREPAASARELSPDLGPMQPGASPETAAESDSEEASGSASPALASGSSADSPHSPQFPVQSAENDNPTLKEMQKASPASIAESGTQESFPGERDSPVPVHSLASTLEEIGKPVAAERENSANENAIVPTEPEMHAQVLSRRADGHEYVDEDETASTGPSPTVTTTPTAHKQAGLLTSRPEQKSAEAARLLALRGLRRIVETCTSRKYAETVASCRRAIEKLEVGTEPDVPEVLEAIKKAIYCGKIVAADIALDTLHRLLTYGYVDPLRGADLDAEQFENLIECACSCIDTKDEGVYIRLTQVLLASATSTVYGLHQTVLLAAVRTLYNIYLSSKSSATQTTARAAIIQIVSLVFGALQGVPVSTESMLSTGSLEPTAMLAGTLLVHRKYRQREAAPGAGDDPEAVSQSSIVVPGQATAASKGVLDLEPVEQCRKDAYLLFRALCKLASKQSTENSSVPTEAIPIRSRLLALQLIRDITETCGAALLQHERFVFALREYLVPTVLQNCMIPNPQVLDVALQLFERMLQLYRAALKLEIAALFHAVVFRFLESLTVAPWQRLRIYQTVECVVRDQQLLMDLFVNYDCDVSSPKIFERLVDDLSRLAIAALQSGGPRKLSAVDRKRCLELLATMLHSLKEWSQPLVDARRQLGIDDEDVFQVLATPSAPADERNAADVVPSSSSSSSLGQLSSATEVGSGLSAVKPVGTSNGSAAPLAERSLIESLRRKRELQEVAETFNRDAVEGVRLAASKGLVDAADSSSVAGFLRNYAGLDRRQVGEYLGGADPFQVKVMHAFTDMVDFSNMRIDVALRKHLSAFVLPGEAQKIDRIAEKFAQRYCACNPTLFASADTAYILAYSIIMLNTDLHNPHIRRKMSLEDFIRNNRGINDGADLPRELLTDIYRSIQAEELRLLDSMTGSWGVNDFRYPAAIQSGEQQRATLFKEESERLLTQTRELFAQRRHIQSLPPSGRAASPERSSRAEQSQPGARADAGLRATGNPLDAQVPVTEVYYTANNVGHVRLMLEVSWQPILAGLSQILENTPDTDRELLALCIDGFSVAVQIASLFEMGTERQALASALAKFTKLHALPDIRLKNVDCIRILLKIALEDGDTLGETWVDVLRAVSLLQQYRAVLWPGTRDGTSLPVSPGGRTPTANESDVQGRNSEAAVDALDALAALQHVEADYDEASGLRSRPGESLPRRTTAEAPNSPVPLIPAAVREQLVHVLQSPDLDRLFMQTTSLSAAAMLDFMEALCLVAAEELDVSPAPRFFCLRQMVRVAHLNMDRIRLEWSRIWKHIANFLEYCLQRKQRPVVGIRALDALRDMARKFLEKEELSNFNFQREVLQPLERCFELDVSEMLKLRTLSVGEVLVREHATRMRSGWKCIFTVLQRAAEERSEKVVERAFSLLDFIVRTYFGEIPEVFVDGIHTLAVFAVNRVSTTCATQAVEHIGVRAPVMVAEQRTGVTGGPAGDDGSLWFPILTALANVCTDGREVLRAYAVELLFRSLLEYGGGFSGEFWVLVFRGVLAPIFDDLHHMPGGDRFEEPPAAETASGQSWAQTTGAGALHGLLMVFEAHHVHMKSLFTDMLEILRIWICQENEAICREGMRCLQRFVDQAAAWMEAADWDLVVNFIDDLVRMMLPVDISREGSLVQDVVAGAEPKPTGSPRQAAVPSTLERIAVAADSVPAPVLEPALEPDAPPGYANETSGAPGAAVRLSRESVQSPTASLPGIESATTASAPAPVTASSTRVDIHADGDSGLLTSMSPGQAADLKDTVSTERRTSGQRSATRGVSERRQAAFVAIRCKCVVQLLLIELVRDLVSEHYPRLEAVQVLALGKAVHCSFRFAHRFNADLALRFDLWRAGFMSQVPNLFRQDTIGRMVYLQILFRLVVDQRAAYATQALEPLLELSAETFAHYNRKASARYAGLSGDARNTAVGVTSTTETTATPSVEEQRELQAFAPVVAFVLENIAAAPDAVFDYLVRGLFKELADLIRTAGEPADVRVALVSIFHRLGSVWLDKSCALS